MNLICLSLSFSNYHCMVYLISPIYIFLLTSPQIIVNQFSDNVSFYLCIFQYILPKMIIMLNTLELMIL